MDCTVLHLFTILFVFEMKSVQGARVVWASLTWVSLCDFLGSEFNSF